MLNPMWGFVCLLLRLDVKAYLNKWINDGIELRNSGKNAIISSMPFSPSAMTAFLFMGKMMNRCRNAHRMAVEHSGAVALKKIFAIKGSRKTWQLV